MSGWFSDWGADPAFEDLTAAAAKAREYLASTSTARKWSSSWVASVEAGIVAASEDADGYITDDVPGFWRGVAEGMDVAAAAVAAKNLVLPEGWQKLRNVYASAGGAAETTAAAREAGSVATVVSGTVKATASDVADVAVAASTAVSNVVKWYKKPSVWIFTGVVVGGLYIATRRR